MMHAIATVPRLYVQTLHLMNKMNLPPPFGPVQNDSIPDSVCISSIILLSVLIYIFHSSSRLVIRESMINSWRVMNQNLNQTRMRSKRKRISRQPNQRSWQQQTRGNDSFCGIRNDDDCVWGRMKSFFSCYKELS